MDSFEIISLPIANVFFMTFCDGDNLRLADWPKWCDDGDLIILIESIIWEATEEFARSWVVMSCVAQAMHALSDFFLPLFVNYPLSSCRL